VRLKNQPFRVVGVAAASFLGTTVVTPDLWLPVSAAPLIGMATATTTDRFNPWLMIGGRLARGATKAQATAEMQVIGRAMRPNGSPDVPRAPADARDVAASSLRWSVESSSPVPFGLRAIVGVFLGLLLAIVSVVLLIASANVAGILLARGAARGREIAVRAAIGASRGRIVRQLLTETMLLGVLGGAVGLLLAHLLTRTSIWLLPATPIPVHVPAALDWRVIIFSFALCLCAALAAGLAPARRVSRTDVVSALRDDSPIPSSHARLRTIFVVVQIALSTMLVVAAGLLVRTVGHVNHIDYGFDARGVVAVTIDGASAGRDAATVGQLVMRFLERAHSVPGTQSVTAADRLPDASSRSVRVGGLHAAGAAEADARPDVVPNWHVVDADYFKTMRIPLLQGREFTADDREGREPVVIVSTSTARQLWPGQNPVGQTLTMSALPTFGRSDSADATRTVVGVAKDLNYGPTGRSAPLDFYVPFRQTPTNVVTVLVRTADENRAIADLRALASTMAADFPPLPVQSLEAMQTGPVQIQLRIATIVTAGVGVIGLFLAILGIHGVTAYVVAQRTKEFGIRIALGADRRDVIAIALRYGMGLVGSGVTIGLVLGAGMGRVLAASPLRTSALDPAVFALAPLLFLVAGLAACYGPARRAGRIDPIMWLRAE
jgi:predicted permease